LRASDLTRLSLEHQRFIRNQAHASESKKKPRSVKPTGYGETFDSQLELDFAAELENSLIGRRIREWRYHPLRFRLAPNVTYTPDFMLVHLDESFALYEVKGSWKMKNARDSRTRLEIAAYRYPWFQWIAITRDREGVWREEPINCDNGGDPQ